MRIALFSHHPSQVWVLRPVAEQLASDHTVIWILRDKDMTLDVADRLGIDYTVISVASTGI
jgi:hypothetical protein